MNTEVRKEAPNHDKLTCYTDYKCRLPKCVDRYNAWGRDRERAIANGTWQPLLDAEPVRRHLLRLHAEGITIYRVAALTGLTYKAVRGFTQHDYGNAAPRRYRVTREVAAKILAINTEDHTPGLVHPIGSERRFQALVTIGWPTIHVARRAGIHPSNRTSIFQASRMKATTAQRIAATYDEMRHQRPARHGVSATSIKRAKQQAADRRWPPPKYWDEVGAIDDEHFEPMYRVTRREIVAQDAHWLMTTNGLSKIAAAERLGVDKSYVEHAFRDHPQYAPKAAA
ncbi:hypothetical protein ABZ438_07790 [Streptomyces sp. NPDC005786]|uniref:hypothetical protein n=1 Tax=Streptomyces sp. NPDC005786 TaxID=3154891 RepID=UPI0033D08930